ncbi:hypothetical protein [Rhodococcus sp. NPDC055024]
MPNALAILGQEYSGPQRTVAVAVLAGAAFALLIGGLLIQALGWRAPFALLLAIMAGTMVIASRLVFIWIQFRGTVDKTSIALSAVGVLLFIATIKWI